MQEEEKKHGTENRHKETDAGRDIQRRNSPWRRKKGEKAQNMRFLQWNIAIKKKKKKMEKRKTVQTTKHMRKKNKTEKYQRLI